MGAIRLERIEKWFGETQVIKGLDLDIADGEFVVLVGPSGCGKTTLLRMVAGLEDVSRGKVLLDGDDVTDKVPSERRLSMVFQSYALYPHMTVGQNMGFGLKTAGEKRADIAAKVGRAAQVLKLDQLLERRPKQLSGGQRQRVAIGRAIVREPRAFLFDEPLSNLDTALRVEMRIEIARLHERLRATMIYVTHDQIEAMTLADKIVLLSAGEIMQVGSPRQLYEQPANLFVAGFIGSPRMNIMECSVASGALRLKGSDAVVKQLDDKAGDATHLGVRPEHVSIVAQDQGHCTGLVEVVEYLGSESYVYAESDELGSLVIKTGVVDSSVKGSRVGLRFDEEHLHLFDASGDAIDL